jgi:hypothetical protein
VVIAAIEVEGIRVVAVVWWSIRRRRKRVGGRGG